MQMKRSVASTEMKTVLFCVCDKTFWHKNSHMHEPRTISLLGSRGNDVALTITILDIPAIIKKAYKEVLLIAQPDSTAPANRLDAFE